MDFRFRVLLLIITELVAARQPMPSGHKTSRVVSETGRVEETFTDYFIGLLDPETRDRLIAQRDMDLENDRFTPSVDNNETEFTILGNITLGPIFSRATDSILFEIGEHPHLLIKYQLELENDIHPLLRESWYGKSASAHGLGPDVYFVSPAARLCATPTGKCLNDMGQLSFDSFKLDGATLRYTIMEKVRGVDISRFRQVHFREGNMGLVNAVNVGRELIRQIQELHEVAKIVHGDIYIGNIMIIVDPEQDPLNPPILQLIDFGRAFPVGNQTLPEFPVQRDYWNHHMCSHWQISGYEWARRDDVMKAVHATIMLMHPFSFIEFEAGLKHKGFHSLQTWKKTGRMYRTPSHDPVNVLEIPQAAKELIYQKFDSLLRISRGLGINDPIPYAELMRLLDEVSEIAK